MRLSTRRALEAAGNILKWGGVAAFTTCGVMLAIPKDEAEKFLADASRTLNSAWEESTTKIASIMPAFPPIIIETQATEKKAEVFKVDETGENCRALDSIITSNTDLRDAAFFDLTLAFEAGTVCTDLLPVQETMEPLNPLDQIRWNFSGHTFG